MQPIEIRMHLRRITMEEIAAGVQPLRQQINGTVYLYHPPIQEYRFREKTENGVRWSDWIPVGFDRDEPDQP